MELLDGQTLRNRINGAPLPIPLLLDLAVQGPMRSRSN